MENWLTKRVLLSPNQKALVYEGQSWTFSQVQQAVLQVAGQLSRLDLPAQAPIAILGANSPQLYFLILAIQQMKRPIVFLNHRLAADELAQQLSDSESCQLFYQPDFQGKISLLTAEWQNKALDFRQLELLPTHEYQPIASFDLAEVTTIMYTSGTTGSPKGVQQTFGNHWWSAMGSALNLGLSDKDSWLCPVPLFHISGFSIMMRSLIYGIPVYLFATFDEAKINQHLTAGEGTIISVVTVMLKRLLANLDQQRYHPNFRCMLLGGGPIDTQTLTHCEEKAIPVIQSYGMTETASQVVALNSQMAAAKLGSAGLPLFPVELMIETKTGEQAAPFEHGEILLKGPNLTIGYLHQPTRSEADWFHTGDAGYLDQEGYLYVVSRLSDIIISGGENIYPAEVEQVLLAFPAILEVAVVGAADAKWEQVPVAYVVLAEEASIDTAALRLFCQAKLAHYKIPKEYIQLTELPRNAAGKVMRQKLVNKN